MSTASGAARWVRLGASTGQNSDGAIAVDLASLLVILLCVPVQDILECRGCEAGHSMDAAYQGISGWETRLDGMTA